MPLRGILLLTCILTVHLVPVIITVLMALPAKSRRKKGILSLLAAVSLGLNAAGFLLAHSLLFRHVRLWETAYEVGMIRFTWRDLPGFSRSLSLCTLFSLALGCVLRCCFRLLGCQNDCERWKARKPLILLGLSWILLILIIWIPVSSSAQRKLVINEICSNNGTLNPDQDQHVWDYIELYNSGYIPYPVMGLYLSDDGEELKKHRIDDVLLPPRTRLLIPLDDKVPFRISDSGETLWLSDGTGTVLDRVACPTLTVDAGYCRVPDGSSAFEIRTGSPGGDNRASAAILPAPVFSQPGGFYSEEFDLFLFSETADEVYYTLDGSPPSSESLHYENPVRIGDAKDNPNVWSMRDDVSAGFLTEALAETGSQAPGYQVPDHLLDKCTVVRAVCIDENGNSSPVVSASYFVDFHTKDGYDGMNILSVVTDPDNLFHRDRGIYILGSTYEAYAALEESRWYDPYWWWWDANYTQRGRMWERPAFLQFFDADRQLILSKTCGMRIQGGGSRGYLPRSFNFYSRKEYDGDNRLKASLFDNRYEPQRVTLFAGGDDHVVKLNDYLMASLIPDRDFSVMKFEPYVLFLNGEYWGCYWLTEKYDEEYFEYYYDVRDDNVVMIKNSAVSLGTEEDMALYDQLRSFVINSDLSLDENYETACELMDMDSFIDYYAAEIYISRTNDWPASNFALWRTREVENGVYSDGRWRWILFDVNSGGMTSSQAEDDTLSRTMSVDPFFTSLMKNHRFYEKFVSTILDMAHKEFSPQRTDELINEFQALMRDPLLKEYSRFYGSGQNLSAVFDRQTEDVRTFFHNRYSYITRSYSGVLKSSPEELQTERSSFIP